MNLNVMRHRWACCGLAAAGLFSGLAIAQESNDLVGLINAFRSEPQSCQGKRIEAAGPLAPDAALARVEPGAGGDLLEAVKKQGYQAARVEAIQVSGPADAAATMKLVRERYCRQLLSQQYAQIGLATVRKTAPRLELGPVRPVADDKTLEAIIVNRHEVMAEYARSLRRASRAEVRRLKSEGSTASELAEMRIASRWLHRDDEMIPNNVKAQVAGALASSPRLAKLVAMREELRMLWTRSNVCAEQLVADLQAWLAESEQSGIGALQEFGLRLRAVRV